MDSGEELYTKAQVDEILKIHVGYAFFASLDPTLIKLIEPQALDAKSIVEAIDNVISSMKKYPRYFGKNKIEELTNKRCKITELYQITV